MRAIAIASALFLAATAVSAGAADFSLLGRRMVVREPGGGESARRVVIVGRGGPIGPVLASLESGSVYLRVFVQGDTLQSQFFALEGFELVAVPGGLRFTGPGRWGNPVEELLVEDDGAGASRIRAVLRGDIGIVALALTPPDPGTSGGLMLLTGVNAFSATYVDSVCVVLGGAAGGTIVDDSPTRWRLKGATAQGTCPPLAPPLPTPVPTPTALPSPICTGC